MPRLLRRSLQAIDADDYAPSGWSPALIVIYLGSNDYVSLAPLSRGAFVRGYAQLVEQIVGLYAAAPPVLHVCGGELGRRPLR